MKINLLIICLAAFLGGAAGLMIPGSPEQVDIKKGSSLSLASIPVPAVVKEIKPYCNFSFAVALEKDRPKICYPEVRDKQNFTALSLYSNRCVYTNIKAGVSIEQNEIKIPETGGVPVSIECELRDSRTAVYINRKCIAELHLDRSGKALMGVSKGIDPQSIKYQPVTHPFLKDDFMRVEGEMGEWEIISGTWNIQSIHNPSMSANAFSFSGKGENSAALIGNTAWNNYYFEVSLNFEKGTEVGIITSYRGKDDYTLCSWNQDHIRLTRIKGKEHELLWKKDKGLTPKQWYRIRGQVSGHGYDFFVDNHMVFSRKETILRRGRFGLYVNGKNEAHFDDAEVGEIRISSLFSNGDGVLPFSRIGGKWKEESKAFTCTATDPAKGVWGGDGWSNYEVSAHITPSRKGVTGVGCYYKGEGNFYLALYDSVEKSIQLISRKNGTDTVLARKSIEQTTPFELLLSVYNSVMTMRAGGSTLCTILNKDHLAGRPFLFGEDCYNAAFENVRVLFKPYIEPVQSENEIFSAEMTMAEWAGSKSDWLIEKEIFKGNTIVSLWNKASFPGDVLLEANIEKLSMDSKVRLMTGADERTLNAGYSFGIRSNGTREALLLRQNKVLAQKKLDAGQKLYRIGFQKISNTVLGLLDGEIILSYEDPEPLPGTSVGWTVAGEGLSREDVWAYSSSVYNYKFTRSPNDWRVASGTWEVANRWQCDPRWTFFSGHTKTRSAVLWNKRKFKGDITVEFYAGIKMDSSRGRKYQYASDINCVIGSSGKEASDGYNFMFGGFKNQKTCITRNKEIVASSATHVIPVSLNIHRRWFYLRIEKRGNTFSYFLDGRKILEFTDPKPLSGEHVGFWTYDNGIMIARVRISSESGDEFADPFIEYQEGCKTIYD